MRLFPKVEGGNNPLAERFDGFIMGCTCSLIRNEQPDVILVHNCILDTFRHKCGVFGDLVKPGLDRTDEWLGDVIEAMEDAGVYEDTNFIILSDHGQMDITKYIHLNALFRDAGLLEVAPDGGIYNWKAYSQANGFSTTVHLVDNSNKKLYDQVYAFLQQLQESGKYGIRKIYTKDELLEQYGQNGPYSFMVEAEDGYGFANAWTGDKPIVPVALRGTHGHTPERGPQPVFLAHGPAFKDGAYLKNAKLVDIAPTLAAVLGQTLPEADGRVLTELLK
jgi:predicted AlkP superfamily pyrophosphatase or phosphodiesterase